MKTKTIERIISPQKYHWVGDGFRVNNFFPSNYGISMERMSPFILLDYASKHEFPPSETPKGVGVHPHRGFETVTIAYKGKVEHHDSTGSGGIIGEGDVQWMTAAGGILHKEYHEREWSKKGGIFQMVQLWVNLPAKYKMSEPKYQPVDNENMGKHNLENGAGLVEVIAGEYKGTKGGASTFSPVYLYNAKLEKDGEAVFDFPANYNTALLVIEGEVIIINKETAPTDNFVLMGNEGEEISIKANEKSIVLIMSGEPLNEPIAPYGPFVMNTQEELIQAFEDFNNGLFGELED